eukprot:432115_1
MIKQCDRNATCSAVIAQNMALITAMSVLGIHIVSANWTPQVPIQSLLPRADSYMAIATHNDSIYILGGWMYPSQLTRYDLTTSTFTDLGVSTVYDDFEIDNIRGYAPFYTQQANNIYMINGDYLCYINVYHLETNTFKKAWNTVPQALHNNACLTSTTEYLIVIGHDKDKFKPQNVHMLSISTNHWLNVTYSTREQRLRTACITDQSTNTVYAIGGAVGDMYDDDGLVPGYDESSFLNTIEVNSVDTMQTTEWMYIDNLTVAIAFARPVIHKEWIFVIGGIGQTLHHDAQPLDIVQMINVNTHAVSVAQYTLPYGVAGAATIVLHGIIYAFGGVNYKYQNKWPGNSKENQFIYTRLNTWMYDAVDHTTNPTTSTDSPTVAPSQMAKQQTEPDHPHFAFGILLGVVIGVLVSFLVWRSVKYFGCCPIKNEGVMNERLLINKVDL